jgi:hypothetical protein
LVTMKLSQCVTEQKREVVSPEIASQPNHDGHRTPESPY